MDVTKPWAKNISEIRPPLFSIAGNEGCCKSNRRRHLTIRLSLWI